MAKRKGRPKEKPEDKVDLAQVERLASLGLTDKEIGIALGLSERTINRYKKDDEFLSVLKKGKEISDKRVERSLFERATGYTHPEEKIFQYEGQIIRADTKKHYPPDTTAIIFWLKNRKPDEWRDVQKIEQTNINAGTDIESMTDEELNAKQTEIKKILNTNRGRKADKKNKK